MAELTIDFASGQWTPAMQRKLGRLSAAAGDAMSAAVGLVKKEGRGVIQAAGLGAKSANALRVNVYGDKRSIDAAAYVFHKIPYFGVFQTGATIKGSPLLWVPLPTAPLRVGGRRVTAGNYQSVIGAPLHTLRRPGRPPLLAAYVAGPPRNGRVTASQLRTGARRARRSAANAAFGGKVGRFGTVSLPLYIGIPQAQIRRRFDIHPVYRRAQLTLVSTFLRRLADG